MIPFRFTGFVERKRRMRNPCVVMHRINPPESVEHLRYDGLHFRPV